MTREEILGKLTEIGGDIFENDGLVLKDETVASDVEGWDSLTHLQFIAEIEDEFNVKFTMSEVLGFKNVGELIDFIEKRAGEK